VGVPLGGRNTVKSWVAATAAALIASAAFAQAPAPTPTPVSREVVEIYRIAPGQQEAFLRFIDKCDEANRIAGVPPRQLYVHSDGAGWDFMLIQPASYPADTSAAIDAAWDKLGLPSGVNFFLEIRKYIAEHTDTSVLGPTTARDYLAGVKKP
jgi:hypothetical protein